MPGHVLSDQFRLALEASPSGMSVIDSGGQIVFANARFAEIVGYSVEKLTGTSVDALVPAAAQQPHAGMRDSYMHDPSARLMGTGRELYARRADGEDVSVEIGLNPLRLNGEDYVICSLADISLRKQAEEFRATEKELALARRIQKQLLPQSDPHVSGFDIAGHSRPAAATGGDYYDYIQRDDGRLVVVLGDVSGHGFGPALLMAVSRTYLQALVEFHDDLVTVVERLNRHLCQDTSSVHFTTLFLTALDPARRRLEYVAAGHVAWHISAIGQVTRIDSTAVPIGMFEDAEIETGPAIDLQDGDIVLLVTDGFVEAESPEGEFFGVDRLIETVNSHRTESASGIIDCIGVAIDEFTSSQEPEDDRTVVVIRVNANAE